MDNEMELPESYKKLRDLLGDEDFYPGDQECLSQIFRLVTKLNDWEANVGHNYTRTQHNDREKAFYDEWMEWNYPQAGVNNGNGILQDLFIEEDPKGPIYQRRWVLEVNHRERMIVATIIQWLGTNVGFAFLSQALARCGYSIKWPERKEGGPHG